MTDRRPGPAAPEATGRARERNPQGDRHVAAAFAASAVLAAATLVVTWGLLFYRPLPVVDGHYRLLGLRESAEIVRDAHGVPRIYARNAHDLFFLQGYATAQDRLFEMDLLRRRTARAGPADGDRRVDVSTRQALDAYAEGVSKLIAQYEDRALPAEFVLLGRHPEPWMPEDSLAILARTLRPLPGSTCFAVPGPRTFKGGPVLAAEIGLDAPGPGWYAIGLEADGLRAIGFALPGVPGIVAGHDGRAAWSVVRALPTREGAAAMLEALLRLARGRDVTAFRESLRGVPLDACYADTVGAVDRHEAGGFSASTDGLVVIGERDQVDGLRAALEGARDVDVERARLLLRSSTPAGSTWSRLVIDLADLDGSRAALPLGQSGQRASPHYDDQLALWEAGQLHPLPFDRRRIDRIEGELVFRPR